MVEIGPSIAEILKIGFGIGLNGNWVWPVKSDWTVRIAGKARFPWNYLMFDGFIDILPALLLLSLGQEEEGSENNSSYE